MLYENLICDLALLAEWDVIRAFSSASPVPKAAAKREAERKPCSQNQTIWLSAGCSWLSCTQPVLQRLAALVSTGQDRHYLAFRNAHERKPHATINIICNLSLNQSHLTRFQFGLDMVFSVYLISAKLLNLIVIV